jgi:hypothetical protein
LRFPGQGTVPRFLHPQHDRLASCAHPRIVSGRGFRSRFFLSDRLFRFVCLLPLALFLQPVHAKPISGGQLGRALEICIINDGQTFDYGDSFGCCQRTPPPPFCAICEGRPEANKVCDIWPARDGRPRKKRHYRQRQGRA